MISQKIPSHTFVHSFFISDFQGVKKRPLQILYNIATTAAGAAKDFVGAAEASRKELALYQDEMSSAALQAHYHLCHNLRDANQFNEANRELGRLEIKLIAARKLDRGDAIVLEMLLNTRVLQTSIYMIGRSIPAALNAAASLEELLKEWLKFFEGHRRVTLPFLSVLASAYAGASHFDRAQAVCIDAIDIIEKECNGDKEYRHFFEKVLDEIDRLKGGTRTDSRHGSPCVCVSFLTWV